VTRTSTEPAFSPTIASGPKETLGVATAAEAAVVGTSSPATTRIAPISRTRIRATIGIAPTTSRYPQLGQGRYQKPANSRH